MAASGHEVFEATGGDGDGALALEYGGAVAFYPFIGLDEQADISVIFGIV